MKSNRRTTLEWALWFAGNGMPVFPLHTPKKGGCSCNQTNCESIGKHPRSRNGFKDASTDEAWVKNCWTKWSDANIGIPTGRISEIVVLDVDPRHGGNESFKRLIGIIGPLPDTVTSNTGGGGKHYLFRYHEEIKGRTRLLPGLDFKAEGGYIVAPPSLHMSGNCYEWEEGKSPEEIQLAELPANLLDFLNKDTVKDNHPARPAKDSKQEESGSSISPDINSRIPDGSRHSILMSMAGSMRRRGMDYEAIKAALTIENEKKCEPPLSESDVDCIATNAAKYQPEPIQTQGDKASGLTTSEIEIGHFTLTDLGNAERLVARHGQDIHYCHVSGKWRIWDGQRWIIDNTAEIQRKAIDTVRSIYNEAARLVDGESRKATVRHGTKSESERSMKAMISIAEAQPGVSILPDDMDKNCWLLNLKNGTVDLRTGTLMPHTREHLITKMAPVEYDPNADAPIWGAFLDRIMDGNQNLISFLQRAIGYALSGDTREECLFLLYGIGANGKSTFLETIRGLMGDYSQQADFSTFIMKNNETVRNDIARLKGARFVAASETDAGKRFAEVVVKQLTGNDTVTARFLFKEYFEFKPTHKIWLAANHKPIIRGTDYAIWRRIKMIPFEVTIDEAERDPQLKDKLLRELPGILKWAIDGCLDWQKIGLEIPEEVQNATESYREEMDVLSSFIEECCIIKPSHRTSANEIYKAYCQWCNENGETTMTQRTLGVRLAEKGFKSSKSGGTRYWNGIKTINDFEPEQGTLGTDGDTILDSSLYDFENDGNLPETATQCVPTSHRKERDFDIWQ